MLGDCVHTSRYIVKDIVPGKVSIDNNNNNNMLSGSINYTYCLMIVPLSLPVTYTDISDHEDACVRPDPFEKF